MTAVAVTRVQRPVGVLLGGSGLARIFPATLAPLPALLKPMRRAVRPALTQERSDLDHRELAAGDWLPRSAFTGDSGPETVLVCA